MRRRAQDPDLELAPPKPGKPNHSHGPFDHERLDAFVVAREALTLGEDIARRIPAERAYLAEQLRCALLDAYLGVAEAASQTGPARVARFRTARARAAEAAAALEAVLLLNLAPSENIAPTIELLGRLCAMLTRLGSRNLPR